ncbi:MAG: ABC transporter permease, partial [Gemmatimonadaceae bacterium]|nr:ABC transporter permease [Gemmatimonadaceae bacterium]
PIRQSSSNRVEFTRRFVIHSDNDRRASALLALGALRANKLRSLLTMLGIVIGVAAVIAVVALGTGAQKAVKDRISALGTTLLTVTPGQMFGGGIARGDTRAKLTMDDAKALEERGTLFLAVQPEMSAQNQVVYLNKNANTSIVGTTSNYAEVRKYEMEAGRFFTNSEDLTRQRVAVVGPQVLQNLGLQTPEALIGESIRIRGIQFEVIGVFKSKGQASPFANPDDQVLIPLTTARFRVIGSDRIRSISVLAPNEEKIPDTMAEIQKILRREHRLRAGRDDDFSIRNQSDFLSTLGETTQVFSFLLAGIAAVSLMVGGIGIMNIMLVSVTERTREIGIRKALGATKMNILIQFLIESVVLCVLGGAIGIAVGAGGALAFTKVMGWTTTIGTNAVTLAFLFSAGVGVVFGVYPARRAAGLDPIVSLRYE